MSFDAILMKMIYFFILDDASSWLNAVRAFNIFSILAAAVGLFTSLLFVVEKVSGVVAGIAFLGSGKCSTFQNRYVSDCN